MCLSAVFQSGCRKCGVEAGWDYGDPYHIPTTDKMIRGFKLVQIKWGEDGSWGMFSAVAKTPLYVEKWLLATEPDPNSDPVREELLSIGSHYKKGFHFYLNQDAVKLADSCGFYAIRVIGDGITHIGFEGGDVVAVAETLLIPSQTLSRDNLYLTTHGGVRQR